VLSGKVDIDNAIKCIPDLCKHVGLIVDDAPQYMIDLHVGRVESGPCVVAIRPVGEWA
jgi:Holliday junction resolvase RusA-like endonuclease